MADFDFSTLGSGDLEELVCDLLNADLPTGSGIIYRTFKDGKDKGIDFLHSTPGKDFDHVGQVKHYYRTGYNGLLTHLKNTEAAKTQKLAPNRYILATSVDLSVAQTQEVRDVFKPYCRSLSDVYGKADLNRLIEAHDDVLHNHYKLWFSDTTVLEKILSSNLIYRSADFVKHELTRRLRIYVKTPILEQALKSLAEHDFIIITGEPGVGKSTLAEMLSYEYIKDGYEFLFINDDIRDAEDFLKNDDRKQVVYYDDFLGSNAAEMNRAEGSESTLLSIIRRVKNYPNKKLIFTTRAHILNRAMERSEKLGRARIRAGETLFNLDEYNSDMKKALLINHIDEADISDELKEVLYEKELFEFIAGHKSFNPRSIEFITSGEQVGELSPEEFRAYIVKNFNDPAAIWSHAYLQQIGDNERVLLNTLLSFDAPADLGDLEKAFDQRIKTDAKAQQSRQVNGFRRALGRLDKGFIVIRHDRVSLLNPSLKDFITCYLATDQHEVRAMMNAIRFIQQLSPLMLGLAAPHAITASVEIKMDMMEDFMSYVRRGNRDHDLIRLATFVQRNVKSDEKEGFLEDMLEEVHDWESLYKDYSLNQAFTQFLDATKDNYRIQDILQERTAMIVNELVTGESDLYKAVALLEQLTDTFKLDFEHYDIKVIMTHLDQLFSDHIFDEADTLRDDIYDPYEATEKIKEVEALVERIGILGLEIEPDMAEFDQDWDEIARDNDFRRMMEKDD